MVELEVTNIFSVQTSVVMVTSLYCSDACLHTTAKMENFFAIQPTVHVE